MSIPGYDQFHEIARHGFGRIYRARELATGRPVHLELWRRVLHEDLGVPHIELRRARAEAAALLDHPNVWQIHRVGECDQGLFLVRLWHEGRSLDEELHARRPETGEAVEWVRQLALAANHVHEHGIIHRDIKPENVWLRDDGGRRAALLTGFDCAFVNFLPARLREREIDAIVGTPVYMAPEQVMGRRSEIGSAVDVWALGVVFYQVLSGRRPFEGETVLDLLQGVLQQEPTRLRNVSAGIDDNLDRICMKCLAKKPEERYASAAALADALAQYTPGERPVAPPPVRTSRFGGWLRGLWGMPEGQSS